MTKQRKESKKRSLQSVMKYLGSYVSERKTLPTIECNVVHDITLLILSEADGRKRVL